MHSVQSIGAGAGVANNLVVIRYTCVIHLCGNVHSHKWDVPTQTPTLTHPHQVAKAPDGNGGLYAALEDSGTLADMTAKGVCKTSSGVRVCRRLSRLYEAAVPA